MFHNAHVQAAELLQVANILPKLPNHMASVHLRLQARNSSTRGMGLGLGLGRGQAASQAAADTLNTRIVGGKPVAVGR